MNSTETTVTVLGAGGRTGRRIVEHALRAGHHVTAAVRHPDNFPTDALTHDRTDDRTDDDPTGDRAARLRVVRADVRDPGSLEQAITGRDVVVSAIDPRGRTADRLYSTAAHATVTAMHTCGVSRVIAITSAGVRHDDHELALWYRILVRPLIRDLYDDMSEAEQILRRSGLDWTLVRPVLLLDRDTTSPYRVGDGATPDRGRTITCAEVADFITGEIDRPRWSRRAPTLAR